LCRLLCIEDDAETRILIKKGLEAAGMTVDTVWAGDKGVEAAVSGRFDCVLLDIMMPGMDGFQVLTTLKTQLATKHIKVIVVTARDDSASRQRALDEGADAYVVKPFKIGKLVTLIRTIVGK
jgi:two-component system, OmpR family, copper resistance phosphate regulon response regulator CusR